MLRTGLTCHRQTTAAPSCRILTRAHCPFPHTPFYCLRGVYEREGNADTLTRVNIIWPGRYDQYEVAFPMEIAGTCFAGVSELCCPITTATALILPLPGDECKVTRETLYQSCRFDDVGACGLVAGGCLEIWCQPRVPSPAPHPLRVRGQRIPGVHTWRPAHVHQLGGSPLPHH